MDRLKLLFAVTLMVSYQQDLIAQNTTSIAELNAIDKKINESIFITTNTNTFVTGETLHYKLYCLNKDSNVASPYSKLAYVELVDSNKKSVFIQKLFLEKGIGNGDYFIPTTLETGNYKLIGYTSWMLNQNNPEFFKIDISIINPYQIKEKKSDITSPENNTSENKKPEESNNSNYTSSYGSENIGFNLKQKTYANREAVTLKINTTDELLNGNYSISVRKMDLLSSKRQLSAKEYVSLKKTQNSNMNINTETIILPELRGEIISGKIFSKNSGVSVENKSVSFSIPGKSYAFKISKTDKNGKFNFNLEKGFSSSNIIIQIIENDRDNYGIEIFKPKQADYTSLTFNTDLQLNPELKNSIEERAVASQVENGYYNKKKDSLIQMRNFKTFFDPLSKEYVLDDFTRFPTLKETIVEIIDGVTYKKNNDKYTIHLYDYDERRELATPALVIVDGLVIQDLNEFFEYKAGNIYKINVLNGTYYFGSIQFNGLISFTTKNSDYETRLKGDFIVKPDILRPLSKIDYYQPNYTDQNHNSKIPDYRYQLLWLPEISLVNKEQVISFFTSDINGTFEIALEGFTDKGLPISVKEIIEVN